MKKSRRIVLSFCMGILLCVLVGFGCGSKQVTVISDPKDVERLQSMMPSRPGQPQPGTQQQGQPSSEQEQKNKPAQQ